LLYIKDATPQTMDALMRLDVSAGVDIAIKQED
jgi:ribosomal protein S10